MGILEGLLGNVDLKAIEAQALEALSVQKATLAEVRAGNGRIDLLIDELKTLNARIKLLVQIMAEDHGRKG